MDGDLTNEHRGSQTFTCVVMDLGKEYKLSELKIHFPDSYYVGGTKVQVFTGAPGAVTSNGECMIFASGWNNNITEIVPETVINASGESIALTGEARYVTIKVSSNTNVNMSEIELFGSVAFKKVTELKAYNYTGSDEDNYGHAYDSAANLLDGDLTNRHHSQWGWSTVVLDLGKMHDLSKAKIYLGSLNNVSNIKLQVYTGMPGEITKNGECVVFQNGWQNNVTKVLSDVAISGDVATVELTGEARYLILEMAGNGSNLSLSEIEIYGVPNGNDPKNDPSLEEITVDGVSILGFDGAKLNYVVAVEDGAAIPTVEAVSELNATIVIEQAKEIPGKAVITSTSEDGTATATYTVYFMVLKEEVTDLSLNGKKVALGSEGIPGYAVDNDPETAFTVNANTGVMFIDLKTLSNAAYMEILFGSDAAANWEYQVDILSAMPSYDGKYTNDNGDSLVQSTLTSGTSDSDSVFVVFDKAPEGRYLRLTFKNADATTVSVKEWHVFGTLGGSDAVSLESIALDGKPLESFASHVFRYYVDLPYGTETAPVVSATAGKNMDVKIKQASSADGKATIEVTSTNGKVTVKYEVRFVVLEKDQSILSNGAKITASATMKGSKAEYANDGKFDTAWYSTIPVESMDFIAGTRWVEIDLGDVYLVQRVMNYLYEMKSYHQYNMAIDASVDGVNYNRVYSIYEGTEGGNALNMEFETTARYLRITYFAASGVYNHSISISELAVYGCEYDSMIKDVTIDGVRYGDFFETENEYVYAYNATVGEIPQFAATVADGVELTIEQSKAQNGVATITVSKDGVTRTYRFRIYPVSVDEKLPESGDNTNPGTGVALPIGMMVVLALALATLVALIMSRKHSYAGK